MAPDGLKSSPAASKAGMKSPAGKSGTKSGVKTVIIPPPGAAGSPSSKPRRAGAREELGAFRRWLARQFSRENFIQFVKTMAWVVPLTLLIWIYAEREQVAPVPDFAIPIELHSSDPDRIVTLQKMDRNLVVTLRGPRAAIDRLREQLGPNGSIPHVTIEIDRSLKPGEYYTLEAARLLSANPIFRERGVEVTASNPSTLSVFVDELVEQEMEVKPPPEVGNLVGTPIFEPARVTLRGPKSAVDKAIANENAYAELDGLEAAKPGEPLTLPNVRIRPLDDPALSFNPHSVKATVVVREANVDYTIKSMPVWTQSTPGLMERYSFSLSPPTLVNVRVTGPPEAIRTLQQEEFQPKAIVTITPQDISEGVPRGLRPRYELPEGVRVKADEQRMIDVTAKKRTETD